MARVLIVDPDKVAASIAQAIFTTTAPTVHTPYGIKCTTVTTAAEALELLRRFNYELIVVDITVAKDGDWSFVRDVREKHPLFSLPVVVAAPFRSTAVEFDAIKHGVNSWVTKPYEADLTKLLSVMCEDR